MNARHRRRMWGAWVGAAGLAVLLAVPLDAQETVGRIEGDDLAVKGQVSMVRTGARKSTELASGSEVTLRSGQARLTLADGSEVDICGPAQFSVLKAGDAVTVALNYGRLHARVSPTLPLTIYTPQVVMTPISIEGKPRDTVVGLEPGGAMCVRPMHGASRLEQQLTETSIVVPQSGEVVLPDGHIGSAEESPGSCRCDVVLMEDRPTPPPAKVEIASVRTDAKPVEPEKKPDPKTPAGEEPKWTVVMPPLTFDASAPVPPAPKPETVILVREARVQPGVVYHGRVEPSKRAASQASPEQPDATANKKPGFFARIGGFFRRLFGGKADSKS